MPQRRDLAGSAQPFALTGRLVSSLVIAAITYVAGASVGHAQSVPQRLQNLEAAVGALQAEVNSLQAEVDSFPAPVTASEAFAFVGVTTEAVTGDTGVLEFNRMCAAAFAGSRFCTSKEVFETVDPPDAPAVEAWAHPVIVAAVTIPEGTPNFVTNPLDGPNTFTGLSLRASQASCLGWSQSLVPPPGGSGTTSFGMVVRLPGGGFTTGACSQPRPVACCAPPSE